MTKSQGHGLQRTFTVNGKQCVFTGTNRFETKAEAIRNGMRAVGNEPHFHYRIVSLKGGGYRLFFGCDLDTKEGHKKIIGHNVQRKYVPKHKWVSSDRQVRK